MPQMNTASSSKCFNFEVKGTLSMETPSDMSGNEAFALCLASRQFSACSGPCFMYASGKHLGPSRRTKYNVCKGLFAFITDADDPNCQIGVFHEEATTFEVCRSTSNRSPNYPVLEGLPISFWNANTSISMHGLMIRPCYSFLDRFEKDMGKQEKSAIEWLTGLIHTLPSVTNESTMGTELKMPGANQGEQVPPPSDWRDINMAWEDSWWAAWEQEANRQAEQQSGMLDSQWRLRFLSKISDQAQRSYLHSFAFISGQGIVHMRPQPSSHTFVPVEL